MATLRRPVFFELPYPTPAVSFYAQPQAVRDAWANWALGNRVGYLDYHRIIRPAPDAYDYVLTMDATLNGGASSLTYPPEPLTPIVKPLNQALTEATIADSLSIALNQTITTPTAFLIWATATAATTPAIDASANKFIGSFTAEPGDTLNQFLGDIGAAYAAAFASLAGDLGKFLVVWAFQIRNGSLAYAGAATVIVKTVAANGCIAYWPLNEPFGTRSSIAQPGDLTPFFNPGQAAGPIDNAALFNGTTQRLRLSPAPTLQPLTSLTVSIWWYRTAFAVPSRVIILGDQEGAANYRWAITTGSPAAVYATISDGTNTRLIITSGGTTPVANVWNHALLTYDYVTGNFEFFSNGVSIGTASLTSGLNPATWPLNIAADVVGATVINFFPGRLADCAVFQRVLSAAEITALYNAGAGLRYPFP